MENITLTVYTEGDRGRRGATRLTNLCERMITGEGLSEGRNVVMGHKGEEILESHDRTRRESFEDTSVI